MSSFTPISSEYRGDTTVVKAIFDYGSIPETQEYTFDGKLTEKEVTEKLAVITKEYEEKYKADTVIPNEVELSLEKIDV